MTVIEDATLLGTVSICTLLCCRIFQDLKQTFTDLTGEEVGEVLQMAGRDVSANNMRLAMHFAVLYANEVGAPKGQPLSEETEVYIYFYCSSNSVFRVDALSELSVFK